MEQSETKYKKWIYYSLSDYDHVNWNKYAYGYKQASLILLKEFENSSSPIIFENLIFPIYFLHRHFTELLLKEIIIDFWAKPLVFMVGKIFRHLSPL